MVVDPTAEYRAELKSLRDQVLASIDGRVIGDLDDGLDLYEQLVRVTFRTRDDLTRKFGMATSTSWVNPYGRELEWLNDDIRLFIDRAWRQNNSELSTPILQFLVNLLETARRRDELVAHKQFLDLLHLAFYRSLTIDDEVAVARGLARSNVVLVRSYAEYQLVHGRTSRSDVDCDALLQVIAALAENLKLAVEIDPPSTRQCVFEIGELLDAIEYTEGRTTDACLSKAVDQISAYVVGVAAYVMMRADRALLEPPKATDLLRELRPLLDRVVPWRAIHVALGEFGEGFPWHHWEMRLWPDGQRSGFLGDMDSSIRRVTAALAVMKDRSPEQGVDVLREARPIDAEHAVRAVVDELEGLVTRPWLVAAFPELGDADRVKRVRQGFEPLLDEFKAAVETSRAVRPIDRRKVDVLARAIETSWLETTGLRGPVRANGAETPVPDTMFGYASLVPKDYFTDSEVHAEPSRLGETIGRALARGETDLILRATSGVSRVQPPGGGFRVAVKEALETLRGRGFDPSIVVINSWRAVVELGRGPFVADPKETERFEGARLDIEYSDGPAMCLVADLSRLLRLRRWRVQPEKPFDVVLADGLLLVGVEEMTVERAAAIVSENPEFRRMADGTLGSPEDAARKLLGQAHVRALVRFDVQIADTEGGLIIPVPDDSTT